LWAPPLLAVVSALSGERQYMFQLGLRSTAAIRKGCRRLFLDVSRQTSMQQCRSKVGTVRTHLARPRLEVPARSRVYSICETLASSLQHSPEVELHASGLGAGLRVFRVGTLAAQELRKVNGYLPGIGCLALRLQSIKALAEAGSSSVVAVVARLAEVPAIEDELLIVRRSSTTTELTEQLLCRLQGHASSSVAFRFVGEKAADRVLHVVADAQDALRRHPRGGHSNNFLAVCPTFGASLSSSGVGHDEMLVSVSHWSNLAPPLPGPAVARLRHHPTWLATRDFVGLKWSDDS